MINFVICKNFATSLCAIFLHILSQCTWIGILKRERDIRPPSRRIDAIPEESTERATCPYLYVRSCPFSLKMEILSFLGCSPSENRHLEFGCRTICEPSCLLRHVFCGNFTRTNATFEISDLSYRFRHFLFGFVKFSSVVVLRLASCRQKPVCSCLDGDRGEVI
jgi:hypothetical protein